MKSFKVAVTRLIEAAPATIYNIVADYKVGHPKIIPKPPFLSLNVLEGGTGAGTKISCEMKAFGSTRAFEAVITEPEPGRVLVETDLSGRAVTTFRVVPTSDGKSEVTIETVGQTERSGFPGDIEAAMSRKFLKRVYVEELALLATIATNSND